MRAESLRAPAPPTTALGGYLFQGNLPWGFAVGNSGFLSLSRQLGLLWLGEKGFSLLSLGYGGGPCAFGTVCGAKPPCLFLWGEALKLSRLALASLVGGPTRAPLPFCPPARATSPWLPGRWTLLQ